MSDPGLPGFQSINGRNRISGYQGRPSCSEEPQSSPFDCGGQLHVHLADGISVVLEPHGG